MVGIVEGMNRKAGRKMYYTLIHKDEKDRIYCECYTIKGLAEEALKKSGHKGLVIAGNGYEHFTNYGLCIDLIDHTEEL